MLQSGKFAVAGFRASQRARWASALPCLASGHAAPGGGYVLLGLAGAVSVVSADLLTKSPHCGARKVHCEVSTPGPTGFFVKVKAAYGDYELDIKSAKLKAAEYGRLRKGALATSVLAPAVNHELGKSKKGLDNFGSALLYIGCGLVFTYALKGELTNLLGGVFPGWIHGSFSGESLQPEVETAVRSTIDDMLKSGARLQKFPGPLEVGDLEWDFTLVSEAKIVVRFSLGFAEQPLAMNVTDGKMFGRATSLSMIFDRKAEGTVFLEVLSDDSLSVKEAHFNFPCSPASGKTKEDAGLFLYFEPVCNGKVVNAMHLMNFEQLVRLTFMRLLDKDMQPDDDECRFKNCKLE